MPDIPDKAERPAIICLAGLDPTGGAGLQADIETIASLGCHALPVATCLTVQDTSGVHQVESINPDLISRQVECLLQDIPVSAIKIGLLPDSATILCVSDMLSHIDAPVVLDPVLSSGSGSALVSKDCKHPLRQLLLPLATVATPNLPEARTLGNRHSIESAAQQILASGCQTVLVSGTHDDTPDVVHHFFKPGESVMQFRYQRLPGEYHGSGCTLSSAIASFLALEHDIDRAIASALDYTWHSLQRGYRIGRGQTIPARLEADRG